MKKILLLGILVYISTIIKSQEISFNEKKGLLLETSITGPFKPVDLMLAMAYKYKKLVGFASYGENIGPLNVSYEPDSYDAFDKSEFRLGFKWYPHLNKKKLKVFYQCHYSYKWFKNNQNKPKEEYINVGCGLDYSLNSNWYLGTTSFFGTGRGQPLDSESEIADGYVRRIDLGVQFYIKYFLFRKG